MYGVVAQQNYGRRSNSNPNTNQEGQAPARPQRRHPLARRFINYIRRRLHPEPGNFISFNSILLFTNNLVPILLHFASPYLIFNISH